MDYFIDTHAHLVHNYDPRHLDEVAESGLVKQVWLLPLNLYVPEFEFAHDDEVLEVGKRYPGLFVPFGFIDYFKGAEQIDRMKEQGVAALKAIRPPRPYDDERYFPIYERAEALGMPVLFHVGIISHRTREQLLQPVKTGPGNMKPNMLDSIADAFPKLKLIQGHMGVPWVNELFESLFYYKNVSCTVTGLVDYDWLIHNLDRRTSFKEPFSSRMMFACDGFYGRPEFWKRILELENFTRMFFREVGKTWHWGETEKEFMHGNAERLFPEFTALLEK